MTQYSMMAYDSLDQPSVEYSIWERTPGGGSRVVFSTGSRSLCEAELARRQRGDVNDDYVPGEENWSATGKWLGHRRRR